MNFEKGVHRGENMWMKWISWPLVLKGGGNPIEKIAKFW